MTTTPTVVLVHAAFTDASSWWPVTLRLLGSGYAVLVPPVDGRSFAADCDYIRRFAERIDGPVLLVGHGYGGAVITVAGSAANVEGLVYVAGYALEEGESVSALRDRFADADLTRHLVSAYRHGEESASTELTVEIDDFPALFGEGVPLDEITVMAVSQRPLAVSALTETAPNAAWRSRPVWAVVAAEDRMTNPELQRFAYLRARARTVVELDAPHLVMQTHPGAVVDVIVEAISDVQRASIGKGTPTD